MKIEIELLPNAVEHYRELSIHADFIERLAALVNAFIVHEKGKRVFADDPDIDLEDPNLRPPDWGGLVDDAQE